MASNLNGDIDQKNSNVGDQIRLNKFLSRNGGYSRRGSDKLIEEGRVLVNNKKAIIGARILSSDVVKVDGRIITDTKKRTILFNKPVGYVCSRKAQGEHPTIYDVLPKGFLELKTAGRLDHDSSGLILLTNDGDMIFHLTHPKFMKSKEYIVKLDLELQPLHQQIIADFGVNLEDGHSKLGLERLDDSRKIWRVVMSEGRNRQIRRTFSSLGYTVVDLHRTHFGEYSIDNLKSGEYKII